LKDEVWWQQFSFFSKNKLTKLAHLVQFKPGLPWMWISTDISSRPIS